MTRRQKGRRVPDRQIAGAAPRLLDIPEEAHGALRDLMQTTERMAQDCYATQGRGFLFWANYPEPGLIPFVEYYSISSHQYAQWSSEEDLVAAVSTYDPRTQFVILEGTFIDPPGRLTDVQISIMGYQYISLQ